MCFLKVSCKQATDCKHEATTHEQQTARKQYGIQKNKEQPFLAQALGLKLRPLASSLSDWAYWLKAGGP